MKQEVDMQKYYYPYSQFITDVDLLSNQLQNLKIDAIVAVARGGVTLGHFLANKLNNRNLLTINSIGYEDSQQLQSVEIFNIPDLKDFSSILLVDDIIDSGDTIHEIIKTLQNKFPQLKIKIVSIFYKKTAIIQPDFSCNETMDWIDFFWEVD